MSSARVAKADNNQFVDLLIMFLLVVGFFLGPLKLLGTSWVSYLIPDFLALTILTLVAAQRVATRQPLLARSQLTVPVICLILFCILELANPEAPFIRSVLGLRSWTLYLSFYFVGLYTLRSVKQLQRLYAVLIGLGIVTAAYGVYQWRAGPQSFAGWSEYYGQYATLAWSLKSHVIVFRAFSTFVAAGTFAANMALLMMIAVGVALSARCPASWRVGASAAIILMGVGIAASGSRGPAVHLVLATVAALVLSRGLKSKLSVVLSAVAITGVGVVLIVLLIGPLVSERFFTLADPKVLIGKWYGPLTDGLRLAQGHPFGMGLGYTAGVPRFIPSPTLQGLPTFNVDSGYGSAAAELGFPGLVVFVVLAVKVGLEGFRTWRRLSPGQLKDLLLGPAVMAVIYPIVSVNSQPQAALPSSIYYWLLIGMLMKAPTLQAQLVMDEPSRPGVDSVQH